MDFETKDITDLKKTILISLATDFSEDKEFLEKINKLTFGLLKQNNLK